MTKSMASSQAKVWNSFPFAPAPSGQFSLWGAATAGLDDVNMIDPFHLQTYGKTTGGSSRDIEISQSSSAC